MQDLLRPAQPGEVAFAGQVSESMTRTQGWRFLEIGRRLERALYTIDLILSTMVRVSPHEPLILEAVLEVIDSLMTYRSRYLANLQSLAVLDLAFVAHTGVLSRS